MIFVRTVNGKKVVYETNARGDIITKDGKSLEPKGHEITDLQAKHQHAMMGFMQRGNNKRR